MPRLSHPIVPLVGISLLAHATLSGGRVAASLYMLQNGYSEILAGLTYGLYSLMPALLALHLGRLVDHAGPRMIMRICLISMVTGLLLPVVHLSLATILMCAALGGLGFGGFILAAHVAVSQLKVDDPAQRTGMYAWQQMGMSVSAVTGPTLIGLVIDGRGFTMAFACLSALVLGGLLWALRADLPKGVTPQRQGPRGNIIGDMMADPALQRIYGLSMAVYLAWDAFAFMMPVLGTARGYSAAGIGLILSFFAVGTFVVRAIQPWLSHRSTEWKTLSLSFAASAIVFVALAFIDGMAALCGLALIFGMAAGAGHPNILNLLLLSVDKSKSGEASGLRLMTGNLAGIVGSAGCGAIVTLAGMTPVFLGIAATMGISSYLARAKPPK